MICKSPSAPWCLLEVTNSQELSWLPEHSCQVCVDRPDGLTDDRWGHNYEIGVMVLWAHSDTCHAPANHRGTSCLLWLDDRLRYLNPIGRRWPHLVISGRCGLTPPSLPINKAPPPSKNLHAHRPLEYVNSQSVPPNSNPGFVFVEILNICQFSRFRYSTESHTNIDIMNEGL